MAHDRGGTALEQRLIAVATTENVLRSLRRYDHRDAAIDRLEALIQGQQRAILDELAGLGWLA